MLHNHTSQSWDLALAAAGERLFATGLVAALAVLIAGLYFTLGRLSCPPDERPRLRELTAPEVWATIVSGWRSVPPHPPHV